MTRRCPCSCDQIEPFTAEDVKEVERVLQMGFSPRDAELILEGMNVELEHCDITFGDPILTVRIALAHLKENNLYYERLKEAGL